MIHEQSMDDNRCRTGLGRAFAEEALRNGDLVIATVRKVNPDDELFKNENVFTVIMDVTKTEEVRAAVDSGLQKVFRQCASRVEE